MDTSARLLRGWMLGLVVALALSVGPSAAARQPAPQVDMPDVQRLGPQVGERVAAFTLRDQHGQSRTLESLIGPKGLMLVFYRSADW